MILNLAAIDTGPGGQGPFAPPIGVQTDDDYRAWLRLQFQQCFGFRQYLAIVARGVDKAGSGASITPTLMGPFVRVVREACAICSDASGDTTPGDAAFTAPPAEFDGDSQGYYHWLRRRYDSDARFRLQLETFASRWSRWAPVCRCTGRYAETLEKSLRNLSEKSAAAAA